MPLIQTVLFLMRRTVSFFISFFLTCFFASFLSFFLFLPFFLSFFVSLFLSYFIRLVFFPILFFRRFFNATFPSSMIHSFLSVRWLIRTCLDSTHSKQKCQNTFYSFRFVLILFLSIAVKQTDNDKFLSISHIQFKYFRQKKKRDLFRLQKR